MCNSILQVDVIIPTQTKYLDLIGSIGEHIAKDIENFSGDREALAYHLNLVLNFYIIIHYLVQMEKLRILVRLVC
jgi:hypothetical protein